MARPATREQFKQYCLRNLGFPVSDINVDDEQLEDRIDEALQYFRDYHFDGSEHDYLKHQVTAEDKINGYITIPEAIQGVVRIFPINDSAAGGGGIFNVRYQFQLNDLSFYSSATYSSYVSTMTNIALMQEILVGQVPIDFNRHQNRIYVRTDWDDLAVGEYLIFEVYKVVDPDINTDVWNDRWLLRYGTALFRRQWGDNLSKFAGVQLPGGITLDGVRIRQDAIDEINKLEEEMITSYSPIVFDMIG